ncbi:hypothetical protein PGTUg99_000171 [Puccinia graminis f. sp. tritici]|uniref:Uncharacterized protein n=1 Tax=Puccinia graminis f. sp. tritici TaxID=56615 RepID=A0A5B0RQA6_PUCGR|nr:hypothetical protein PGTUg99_000171 [Puccinia graminis f. sp. tritici]
MTITLSSLFHNRSTLALVTAEHSNNRPSSSSNDSHNNNNQPTTTTRNNPYRNQNNSRFTLSFNNLINRSRTQKTNQQQQPTTQPQHNNCNPNQQLISLISIQKPNPSEPTRELDAVLTRTTQAHPPHPSTYTIHPNNNNNNNNNNNKPTNNNSTTTIIIFILSYHCPTRTSSAAATLPSTKSIYFPGLRRIQSRRKDKDSTANLLSSILSPSSSSTQD